MGMRGRSFEIAFGLVCIYAVASFIRMGNWVQNDTYRAAGDAVYGTVLEIVFMWIMVIPLVWCSGMVWHLPTLVVFAFCYSDEPIRYILMQIHLFRGTWIKPVTPEGQAALEEFREELHKKLPRNLA
jgi:Na+-driven multidrug efflux pump